MYKKQGIKASKNVIYGCFFYLSLHKIEKIKFVDVKNNIDDEGLKEAYTEPLKTLC